MSYKLSQMQTNIENYFAIAAATQTYDIKPNAHTQKQHKHTQCKKTIKRKENRTIQ